MDERPNRKKKAVFCDGLMWTEGLTVEIKLWFFYFRGTARTGSNKYTCNITSSNHRLESAGLKALQELLFKMLGMG